MQTLPLAGRQAGVTGGKPWQELIVTVTHLAAGLALIATLVLLVVGFLKPPPAQTSRGV